MSLKLPPLSSLRAFEAAARLESFSRAADELHVTHSAVSHQVKSLEEFLNTLLFTRSGKRVGLTNEGKLFANRIRTALRDISDATDLIRQPHRTNHLAISVLPSFAARWLMPRLGRFMEHHPELEVHLHASPTLVDFSREDIEVAIRFGRGNWPNVEKEKFMDDEYFPVCSPRFNHGRLPKEPKDLAKYRLLRSDQEPWTPWFQAAKLNLPEPRGPEFNDSAMTVQAAVGGQGIALSRRTLAENDLIAGNLIRLFNIAIPSPGSYYLVWRKGTTPSVNFLIFRDWLFAEKRRKH